MGTISNDLVKEKLVKETPMLIMRMAVGHVIHLHKDPRIQQKKTMKYAHSDEDHLIIANSRVPARGGGGGGGGHCLFEGNYPLPNYRPRYLGLSAPLTALFFDRPLVLGV